MGSDRELIILPKASQAQLAKLIPQLESEGIKTVYADPKKIRKKTGLRTIFASPAADYVVLGGA